MISIVIPTYNEEKIIADTLERLRKIKYPHEVIVSDGKSTDRTVEIARKYADKVIVWNQTGKQTIASARNAGGRAASGEFILFLDADCRIPEADSTLERAVLAFNRDKRLVAQAARIKVFPEVATFWDNVIWSAMNTMNSLLNISGLGGAPGEFQMIRKYAFEKVGGYDEKLVAAEDYDIFRRLSKLGKVRLNNKLVVYHSGRHSRTLGWPRLLSLWFLNFVFSLTKGKAYSKKWEVIR